MLNERKLSETSDFYIMMESGSIRNVGFFFSDNGHIVSGMFLLFIP
jgi:hypothetical protein